MDNSEPPESSRALSQFRLDIMNALADIQVELRVLQVAAQQKKPVSEQQLKNLRKEAKKERKHLLDHYAETISRADELR